MVASRWLPIALGAVVLGASAAAAGAASCSSSGDSTGQGDPGGAGAGGGAGAAGKGGANLGGGGSGGGSGGSAGAAGKGGAGGGIGGAAGAGGGAGAGAGAGGGAGAGAGGAAGSGGAGGGGAAGGGTGGSAGSGGAGGAGGAVGVVKFAAMGDTGRGNASQKKVAAAIAAKCQKDGCDFVQLLGDNIIPDGAISVTDPQWQDKFEVPYQAIDLPFWVVLGNHDYGGNGAGFEVQKAQVEVDYTGTSKKWKMPAKHWQHPAGNALFVGLDTNEAMFSQHDAQKKNVAGWLAASGAKWKIAFGHHPYISNGPHGNAGSYDGLPFVPIVNGAGVKDLLETTVCGKVDVYICGHDHSRQWVTPKCTSTELIISGGGSDTTDLPGKNATYFQSTQAGFLWAKIEGNSFYGEIVDDTGKVNYTRTITK